MSKFFDVCVRGDGIVGRATALLLAKERLKVALVVPALPALPLLPALPVAARSAQADCRAYALNSASKHMLESLRVWPDAPFVTPVQTMRVCGDDGGQLEFHAGAAGQSALTWIVDVPQLEAQLRQACSYQSLLELVAEPDAADLSASLTIICEGQKSGSRGQVSTQWSTKPYAQKAVAARLTSSQPHGGCARQWFLNGGESGGVNGAVLALLPMGGAQGNAVALVWSVSDTQAAELEKLTDGDFCTALSAALSAAAGPAGQTGTETFQLTSNRACWPLALSSADRWVGTGWALAGDAAHTIHPLAGQGLNLGLADAACLTTVLAEREYWRGLGDEKLLRRYERARKAELALVAAVTDGLQSLFSQPGATWQSVRNWGMRGVQQSQPLKTWLMQRAAGQTL